MASCLIWLQMKIALAQICRVRQIKDAMNEGHTTLCSTMKHEHSQFCSILWEPHHDDNSIIIAFKCWKVFV